MALPKLTNVTYELELPSTGDSVKYRPFLVKEQKTLMINKLKMHLLKLSVIVHLEN